MYLVMSMAFTIAMNILAGAITLAHVNGTTIIEFNRSSRFLLNELGSAALLVHVFQIAVIYSLAFALSVAITSAHPAFSSKRILMLAFYFIILALPIGGLMDFVNDILVVYAHSNVLASSGKLVITSVILAFFFAFIPILRMRRRRSTPVGTIPQNAGPR